MPPIADQPSRDLHRLFIESLESRVESILKSYHPGGRFGTEPWIVRDQDVILTLALLYKSASSAHQADPYFLEMIAAGGRYLRERQDEKGMYVFNKKDGSEWGMIYMPWTYLRWMITYDLIGKDLPEEDRRIWEEGLLLGYGGVSATELTSASNIYPGPLPFETPAKEGEVIPWIHNIPSHHATGLYLAGRRFGRPDWMAQAIDYMHKVVGYQSKYGWWTEHVGPVVLYNRVYLEALALFYHFSRDETVKGALESGNAYHLNYTYPDGSSIETVDERNPYYPIEVTTDPDGTRSWRPKMMPANPGLYYTDEGRALLDLLFRQLSRHGITEIDNADFLLLCLPEGGDALGSSTSPLPRHRMGDDALLVREDPWLLSFSAYCAPRTPNRFIQDRQNLLSIYHRDTGLIIGGGNSKIQPRWSTMTVGDTGLVSPEGSVRETNLAPETALSYVPEAASIKEVDEKTCRLTVETGGGVLSITTEIHDEGTLSIRFRLEKTAPDARPVAAHLTFIRYPETSVRFSDGSSAELDGGSFERTGLTSVGNRNWDLSLPRSATVLWPVLPHNPYTGDGHAQINEGRMVVSLPFEREGETIEVKLTVAS